ncbi:MAG: ADP-glyceromanno-heptose 6-epimerase [Chitinophagaceae bacterium]|nr:MAG: ADP-glyceromanno-heptose 6-epimerase [Chitinophagaceae bacterium]
MIKTTDQIVITGAAGFIGSCLVSYLNNKGFENLVLVDDFSRADKVPNLESKKYTSKIEREVFFDWLESSKPSIRFVFHIGAKTDTTEFDYSIHEHLNVAYSKKIWNWCADANVPVVYASSAATYGSGAEGYSDDHNVVDSLKPLNPYGVSKNEFDKWALKQHHKPPFWAGLKFFNVYGPNEYHKGRMASVIFHSYGQILKNGVVNLFRSHRPDFRDGQQLRDFIYVKDIMKVCYWLMENSLANSEWASRNSAIYNLGTGKARAFEDLVKATFSGVDKLPEINFIDMPEDIRDKYQYFTEADMHKLTNAGYDDRFFTLEEGVDDYVRNYLSQNKYY